MYYVVRAGNRSKVVPGNGSGYYAGKFGDERNVSRAGVTYIDTRKSVCESVASEANGKANDKPTSTPKAAKGTKQ